MNLPYEFQYFLRGSGAAVSERRSCTSDGEARARAAAELLQMPGRDGVDVWSGDRLVYRRRRRGLDDAGPNTPGLPPERDD